MSKIHALPYMLASSYKNIKHLNFHSVPFIPATCSKYRCIPYIPWSIQYPHLINCTFLHHTHTVLQAFHVQYPNSHLLIPSDKHTGHPFYTKYHTKPVLPRKPTDPKLHLAVHIFSRWYLYFVVSGSLNNIKTKQPN